MSTGDIICSICKESYFDCRGHHEDSSNAWTTPIIYKDPHILNMQIEHNQVLNDFNKQQYNELHKEPEINFDNYRNPITEVALRVALDLEKRLVFEGPYSGEIKTGSLHELIYTAVQLLRTFGNE